MEFLGGEKRIFVHFFYPGGGNDGPSVVEVAGRDISIVEIPEGATRYAFSEVVYVTLEVDGRDVELSKVLAQHPTIEL